MRTLFGTRALTFAFMTLICTCGPAAATNAFPKIQQSLALLGTADKSGKLVGEGTAFCVSSDGTRSYFLTANHVLTDERDAPVDSGVMILARDMNEVQPHRYPVTIVRRSIDPDLALVSIDVPNLPHVRLSHALPEVGDEIAIAGFPYTESVFWGAIFGGRGPLLDHRFPRELTPSMHRGAVSALHGGSYYIQYDALTDSGNSGGPLFDPQTGDVFGVVQAATEGAREYRDLPSPIHNNLAISTTEGWQFIAQAPVTVDATVAAGGEHLVSRQMPRRCRAKNNAFEMAYGRWAQAHGEVEAMESATKRDPHGQRALLLARAARRFADAESRWQRKVEDALRVLHAGRSGNTGDSRLALLQRVRVATASDTTLAAVLLARASARGRAAFVRPSGIPSAQTLDISIAGAARDAFMSPRC